MFISGFFLLFNPEAVASLLFDILTPFVVDIALEIYFISRVIIDRVYYRHIVLLHAKADVDIFYVLVFVLLRDAAEHVSKDAQIR